MMNPLLNALRATTKGPFSLCHNAADEIESLMRQRDELQAEIQGQKRKVVLLSRRCMTLRQRCAALEQRRQEVIEKHNARCANDCERCDVECLVCPMNYIIDEGERRGQTS